MMRSLRSNLLLLAMLAVVAPLSAQSTEGPWMIRIRALALEPANKSTAIPSLNVAEDAITVSSKIFPEVDISYFFTPRIAAELVLTYPQSHDVELGGTPIGSFKHLPPTLMLQYHAMPTGTVRPYIGAGVNLTLLSDVALNVPGVGALDLEDSSIGGALQAGADVQVGGGYFLNLDAKKVIIRSDVLAGGAAVSTVKVDPWLLSIGIGRRF
jgi:outer membrane protein